MLVLELPPFRNPGLHNSTVAVTCSASYSKRMTFRRHRRIVALVAMLACAKTRVGAGQSDAVPRARALAIAGERAQAITLLQDAVAATPGNSDARVLLGTVLSWDGRYDEARRELETVLATDPTHGDALHAEINV